MVTLLLLLAVARDTSRVMPLGIAHRGASAYLPEHTLAAYRLAIAQGADVIEPDLVRTRDGVLVARHENEIGGTTDVATRFPARRTTRQVDGTPVTGWFVEDFSLAELRTLRAVERLPFRSHAHDGVEQVPTFDEILALVDSVRRAGGRTVGVYPETKHAAYFRAIGLPLEEPLVAALAAAGLDRRDSPVFIQSFEPASLRRLRSMTKARLVQLIGAPGMPVPVTAAGLADVATYADGIGIAKEMAIPVGADGALAAPTTIVADAHAAGLFVHLWTFRPEDLFLPAALAGKPDAELAIFLALGVDGLFTDAPDLAVRARSLTGRWRSPADESSRSRAPR